MRRETTRQGRGKEGSRSRSFYYRGPLGLRARIQYAQARRSDSAMGTTEGEVRDKRGQKGSFLLPLPSALHCRNSKDGLYENYLDRPLRSHLTKAKLAIFSEGGLFGEEREREKESETV